MESKQNRCRVFLKKKKKMFNVLPLPANITAHYKSHLQMWRRTERFWSRTWNPRQDQHVLMWHWALWARTHESLLLAPQRIKLTKCAWQAAEWRTPQSARQRAWLVLEKPNLQVTVWKYPRCDWPAHTVTLARTHARTHTDQRFGVRCCKCGDAPA